MQTGKIYALGTHRLMCGDATNRDDVMRLIGNEHINLVLTDPPYGIKSVDRKTGQVGFQSQKYHECIGDWNRDMFIDSYRILRGISNALIIWGGQNFCDIIIERYEKLLPMMKAERVASNA